MMVCNKNFAEKKKDTDSPSQIWGLENTRRQLNPAKHQHDCPGQLGMPLDLHSNSRLVLSFPVLFGGAAERLSPLYLNIN